MNLKEKLISENKTRWLDIGNGGNFEDGFYYMDILPLNNNCTILYLFSSAKAFNASIIIDMLTSSR